MDGHGSLGLDRRLRIKLPCLRTASLVGGSDKEAHCQGSFPCPYGPGLHVSLQVKVTALGSPVVWFVRRWKQ